MSFSKSIKVAVSALSLSQVIKIYEKILQRIEQILQRIEQILQRIDKLAAEPMDEYGGYVGEEHVLRSIINELRDIICLVETTSADKVVRVWCSCLE